MVDVAESVLDHAASFGAEWFFAFLVAIGFVILAKQFLNEYQRNCDGDFGYYSVCALQQHLLNVGCYWDEHGECVVDGDWGSLTTVAIQRAINAGVL